MCVKLTASCPLNNIQVGTIADRAPEDEIFTSEESIEFTDEQYVRFGS
jgi:hypothetical protein